MEFPNFVKNSMVATMGIIMSNSTASIHHFAPVKVECHSAFYSLKLPTATRFNNAQRYSLEQLKLNKRKLISLKQLGNNWNGYDSQRFSDDLISKVISIISNLDYQPQIFPTGRGTIQMEKYRDENNFVEIEISTNEIFAYQVKNGNETESVITVDEIKGLISELYA